MTDNVWVVLRGLPCEGPLEELIEIMEDDGHYKDFVSALGWVPAAQGLVGEDFIVNFYEGEDDGVPVRIRVYYRSSLRTRTYLFHRAVADWPGKGVQNPITSQTRLRQLFEAYAPKEN